jgi:hypothetical protein
VDGLHRNIRPIPSQSSRNMPMVLSECRRRPRAGRDCTRVSQHWSVGSVLGEEPCCLREGRVPFSCNPLFRVISMNRTAALGAQRTLSRPSRPLVLAVAGRRGCRRYRAVLHTAQRHGWAGHLRLAWFAHGFHATHGANLTTESASAACDLLSQRTRPF